MATAIEIGAIGFALLLLLFGQRILGSLRALAANAVGGVATLLAASWFGFGVVLSPVTLAITALAGIPGAILVLLLAYGGVAFIPPEAGEAGSIFVDRALHNLDRLIEDASEFVEFMSESDAENASETVIDG